MKDARYDAIIVGSGMGGGTLARALTGQGKHVLVLERGGWLPREPQNWDTEQVFQRGRYTTTEQWIDGTTGRTFTPGEHYYVGGKTKLYGAALFAARDMNGLPVGLGRQASYYQQAKAWYHVHYEPHAPVIAAISDVFTGAGFHPQPAPVGTIPKDCVRCHLCDGFACPLHAKADAETCGIRPAWDTGLCEVRTGIKVTRLNRNDQGVIGSISYDSDEGRSASIPTDGAPVFLCAGAVNSAAIWLRSEIPDVSGQAGRNYMCHQSSAVLATGKDVIPPGFHKTLYVPIDGFGTIQMAGQPQPAMLKGESELAHYSPSMMLREIAERSVTFWLMTEDHPNPDNRVEVTSDGRIRLTYDPYKGDVSAHDDLYRLLVPHLPDMGFHLHMRKRMPLAAVAHQCGTLRAARHPYDGPVREDGRAFSTGNLFVSDASVFPRSGEVNPALTVAAWALRVAEAVK